MKDITYQLGILRQRMLHQPDERRAYEHALLLSELYHDYPACIELYREVLDAFPYACLAWYYLGIAYRQNGQTGPALEAFEYAYLARPDFEDAYCSYAELALQTDRMSEALACLREAERFQCSGAYFRSLSASYYLRMGDFQRAKSILLPYSAQTPPQADMLYLLGVCCVSGGAYQEAAGWYQKAIRAEEGRDDFHRALADTYRLLGKLRLARHHYWRAIDLAPDEAPGWLNLAEFLLHTATPHEALDVLDQASDHAFGPHIDCCRAACLFLLQRRKEAIPLLLNALNADSSQAEAFFKWAPDLASDVDIRNTIAAANGA